MGHLKNVNTFSDNLEQAIEQLGKNYAPLNIYNLIVKRSLFLYQNKKVQIIFVSFQKQTPIIKGWKDLLSSVYSDANVWLKEGVEDSALGQMSNFFGSAFYM